MLLSWFVHGPSRAACWVRCLPGRRRSLPGGWQEHAQPCGAPPLLRRCGALGAGRAGAVGPPAADGAGGAPRVLHGPVRNDGWVPAGGRLANRPGQGMAGGACAPEPSPLDGRHMGTMLPSCRNAALCVWRGGLHAGWAPIPGCNRGLEAGGGDRIAWPRRPPTHACRAVPPPLQRAHATWRARRRPQRRPAACPTQQSGERRCRARGAVPGWAVAGAVIGVGTARSGIAV